MKEYNGIKIKRVDNNGFFVSTPVNEFIFSAEEINFIYLYTHDLEEKEKKSQ